jgi:hypothetical protein
MRLPLEIRNGEVTYVMRCGDYVKIGYSTDPERRCRRIFMPGNPLEITILATFPLGELYERFLHDKFKAYLHRDEWFRIEGSVAAWIARGFPHKKEIRSLLKLNRERAEAHARWRVAVAAKKAEQAATVARVKMAEENAKALAMHAEFWRTHDRTTGMKIPEVTT